MSKTYPSNSKTIQTLRLLNEHGALSARTIRKLVVPECTKQYAKWMLGKLKRNGLVRTRHDRIFGKSGIFYELRSEEISRLTIANLIGAELNSVRINNGINRELLHAEEQALWIEILRRKFDSAQIISDNAFFKTPVVQNLLPTLGRVDDLSPDIVMLPFGAYSDTPFSIAIEIERSIKTKKRIREKLTKYAMGSKFDGVLYVCSMSGIEEAVRKNYLNAQARKSVRIQNYSDRFLAFGNLGKGTTEVSVYVAGDTTRTLPLSKWIHGIALQRSSWDLGLKQIIDYPR